MRRDGFGDIRVAQWGLMLKRNFTHVSPIEHHRPFFAKKVSSSKAPKETHHISGKSTKLTVPEDVVLRVEAKASQPIMRAIS